MTNSSLREKQRRYLGDSVAREVQSGKNRISGIIYADENGFETGNGPLEFRWEANLEGDPRSLRSVSLIGYSFNGLNPRKMRENATISLAADLSEECGLGIKFERNPESDLVLARYDSLGEPPNSSGRYLDSGAIRIDDSEITVDLDKIDGDPRDALLEVARIGLEIDAYRRKRGAVTLLVKKDEVALSFDPEFLRVDEPRKAVSTVICLYDFALNAR